MDNLYTIKQTAEIFNISENKIRFYEKKGLIKPERDSGNNYRLYTEDDLVRIQTILMYRQLDISIEDICDLMQHYNKSNIISHFYKQWKILNDEMHKLRSIKESFEEIMDSIYSSDESQFLHQAAETIKKLGKNQKIKNNWKDRWNFNNWARNYDCSVKENRGHLKLYKNYETILKKVYECSIKDESHDAKFLEIGVGTGNLASKYLNDGYNIVGVDQSIEMLSVAKEKYPNLKLRLGEFLKLPFDNTSFDCIVSTYSFHHLNDEEKKAGIREMLRVLKHRGQMVIGDIMYENDESRKALISTFTDGQRMEFEDEYFSNIEFLQREFGIYGKQICYERIDELNYILHVY